MWLVGSRINALEIKSLTASWKLPTLRRPERALIEEGTTLCPAKRTGNTHCLPFSFTHIRKEKEKKKRSIAFFEKTHDIKVIPMIRGVLSFLHIWG